MPLFEALLLLLVTGGATRSQLKEGSTVLVHDSAVSSGPGLNELQRHCDTCALTQRIAGRRRPDSYDAVAVDEDVVVLSIPGLVGLVVIPRRHVSGLEELPPLERARVLAALRRAFVSIGEEYHGSAPRVVATTDPPALNGHVGFRLFPGDTTVDDLGSDR